MPLFSRNPAPEELTVTEAHERVRTGQAVLLDVREADEYTAGHAPGAVWQTLTAVAAGAPLPEGAGDLPVLAVCRSGNRSRKAAELLSHRGVHTLNVTGGMRAWAAAGLPVRTGTGRDGHVI
ncbi:MULTISPECIES: rhodanese-like domain-containing protein [unclassified Streptomyces]|uniref:rhodanese-like domain-containing protein n=1 Tax=unclassified Streptomyces TaxID=2593676 RepID=UPI000380C79E|nr:MULTISPECIES: rhodanese-like domain-containing protein [unclassified Streptomyces]MYX32773.1 rhodanese-like domain-containing protein [Streptomyces sp. SID8377]